MKDWLSFFPLHGLGDPHLSLRAILLFI